MPLFKVVPVRVVAAAVTVILLVPSKFIPLMVLAVANRVAVDALPDKVAPINWVACTVLNTLVPLLAVTLPVILPTRSAVITPAENPPWEFLATTFPMLLEGVASTFHVISELPSKSEPRI